MTTFSFGGSHHFLQTKFPRTEINIAITISLDVAYLAEYQLLSDATLANVFLYTLWLHTLRLFTVLKVLRFVYFMLLYSCGGRTKRK